MRAGEPPAPVTLPLLCALGRHKTDGLARWNAGYYFARCTRCRRDLVRTAFTRWQIPRGFRVVWQGDGVHARPTDERGHVAAGARVEFPIRDDVRSGARDMPSEADFQRRVDAPVDTRADDPTAPVAFADNVVAHEDDRLAHDMPRQDVDDVEALVDPDAPVDAEAVGDARNEGIDGELSDEAAESRSDTPSWFDRDQGFEEEVRFDADDRLADYRSVETPETNEDAAVSEVVSEPALSSDPEVEPEIEVEPESEPEPEPEPAPPPVASKYPVVPDFMDEGPAGVGWEAVTGRIVPRAGAVAVVPEVQGDVPRDVTSGVFSQGWQGLVRKRAQGAGEQGREWLRGKRAPRPGPEAAPSVSQPTVAAPAASDPRAVLGGESRITVSDAPMPPDTVRAADVLPTAAGTPSPPPHRVGGLLMQHSPLVAALVFGALVVAAAVVDGRNSPPRVVYMSAPEAPTAAPADRRAAVSPTVAAPRASGWAPVVSDVAYVTAGLLNCRATPSNDAATTRRLSRGAPVRVLGTNPGWVSVAHQGQQCWVSEQHVSKTKPA